MEDVKSNSYYNFQFYNGFKPSRNKNLLYQINRSMPPPKVEDINDSHNSFSESSVSDSEEKKSDKTKSANKPSIVVDPKKE